MGGQGARRCSGDSLPLDDAPSQREPGAGSRPTDGACAFHSPPSRRRANTPNNPEAPPKKKKKKNPPDPTATFKTPHRSRTAGASVPE